MPFTFSHPAIVLPFLAVHSRWLSATGLIIGSMTPDFEKFIRMSIYDPYSHTWRSIFYFNLPMGLLLCFVFHLIVRNALIDHLPLFLRQRFVRYKHFNWTAHFKKHYPVVVLSLFIGIVSHLAWDSFTHKGGLGVRLFPMLDEKVFPEPFRRDLFAFLQEITSVLGAMAMAALVLRLPKEPGLPQKKSILGYWFMAGMIVLNVVAIFFLTAPKVNRYYLIIASISASLLSLIILPFLIKIRDMLLSDQP